MDSENQIIVAAEVTQQANDKKQAVPMAQAALDNLAAAGIEVPKYADNKPKAIPNTADTGYFSEKAVGVLESMGLDPHIAVGREKDHETSVPSAEEDVSQQDHHEASVPTVQEEAADSATTKEKMQRKLSSVTGKLLYAARKHIVEPVFGQIKSARGIRKFLLRGLKKVSAEWQLICMTHNILKIWRRCGGVAPS